MGQHVAGGALIGVFGVGASEALFAGARWVIARR